MDVDTWNTSAADNCMDVMGMMMQMEKFPEFCDPFYGNQTYSDDKQPIVLGSSCDPSNTLMTNPSHSAAFVGNVIQKPVTPPIQSDMISGRLKSTPFRAYHPSSDKKNSMAAMREMIFRMAVMQPIHIDPESIKPPKRRNVKISTDPQSVAARHRRERISERIRILQKLVPGGTKMDTASMLDEAIHYVKFLKKQVQTLEQAGANRPMGVILPGTVNTNMICSELYKGDHSYIGSMA